MKLSSILVQFLYTHKQLSLAGIGRFIIEDADITKTEKAQRGADFYKIQFEQDTTVKEDKELIAFTSAQTGKMKSLAAADLDSYLELVKQFLNIGKPFLFEGIGTLSKNKSGQYDFVQVHPFNKKPKESSVDEFDQTSTTEDSFTDYEEMFLPGKPKMPYRRKIAIWLACVAGLILAVWGGYMVYHRSVPVKKEIKNNPDVLPDTLKKSNNTDKPVSPSSEAKIYRFVIEKAEKSRAIARYNYLKSLGVDIKMQTQDSVTFKLFFDLPSLISDTTKIRDSLGLLYSTRGRPFIDQ